MSPSWPVEVVPLNPVSCASALWRMDGFLRVTIVVKATFGLVPDGPARMIAPEEIVPRDRHHDKNPVASVEAAGEIAPYLPKAGVVLVGHAYGPSGQAVPAMSARLCIVRERALIDKTVHVFGDRSAANPGTPRPFQRMPLRYERAFGGPEIGANPIGTGAAAGSALPNLVDPGDPRRTAGFGPIAASWPTRRSLLDAAARARVTEKIPDLGSSFAFGYFQPAPLDQQLDAIEGDEWIVLDGLHPALPRVKSRLPSVRGEARAMSGSGPLQPVELTADLMVIDADRQVCSVIWRGHLVVGEDESALAGLRIYAGVAMPGRPLAWPEAVAVVAAVAPVSAPIAEKKPEIEAIEDLSDLEDVEEVEPDPDNPSTTTAISLADLEAYAKKAATPFVKDQQASAAPPRSTSLAGTPWAQAAAPVAFFQGIPDETTTGTEPPSMTAPPAMIAPPAPMAPPAMTSHPSFASEPDEADATAMISLADLEAHALRAVVPFASTAAAPHSAPRATSLAGTPWGPSAPQIVAPPGLTDEGTHVDAGAPYGGSAPTIAIAATAAPPARKPPTRGDKPAIPIVNPTPLLAVTVPWQIRPPKDSITIVVKGTFDIVADGPAVLRAEGEFPIGDLHVDDDPEKGLAYGSDLGIFKTKADVTLVGTAYAPPSAGGSTPAMQVEFRFGSGPQGFVRRAAVIGDRYWQKALLAIAPTEPESFETMPLTWERAFGGPSFDANPVGAGHKGHVRDGVASLPNLEDPAHLVRSPGDTAQPACFAPIAMLWKERWSKLGTYDHRWFKQRWPYFPEDFDWAYFQIAPKPQQLPYLVGDETFSVVGMRPDKPRLDGRLPGMRARCFVQMTDEAGADFRELPLVLDTAALDVDALKLSLVWRAFIEVSDEEAPEIEAIFIAQEDLAATPITVAEAREQYLRAATPTPPEETEPKAESVTIAPPAAPEPEKKNELAEARAEVRKQLEAAGIAMPDDDAPVPEPAAPDPVAIASSLRAAGASEQDIAEVIAAITLPVDEPANSAAGAPSPQQIRAKVIEMLAANEPFDGLDLAGADLADLDFTDRSLVETLLKGANLARSSFAGAKLEGAILARADLTEARFTGADLTTADLTSTKAKRSDFTGAKLDEADFSGADLEGAVLDGAHGESTHFERCRLAGAQLAGVNFVDADFTRANLDGAVLDKASLPQVRLYDITAHGASFRDVVMPGARVEGARATKAIFSNLDAPGSVWERALLNEATFLGAVLPGASFARATCLKTVFSTADLTEARFRRAKLGGASFLHTNLMMATFERADLTLADLRGANLHAAETWKAKLDHAKLDGAIVTGSKLE